jgi:predicted DsbA family dithiol-disulfide isomerase
MTATAWSDYVCPWAYLGRDRTALMRDLGVEVTVLPYELHPEIPPEGVEVRPGGRLARVFATIGAECDQLGIEFTPPRRSPNTHHVLEVAEVVRVHAPEAYPAFDRSLARAHWVEGRDLGDRDLVTQLLDEAGGPVDEIAELVADGAGSAALTASMAKARSVGVMATPAWWVDDALLIPGAQPRETIERWITKMLANRARPTGDAVDTIRPS